RCECCHGHAHGAPATPYSVAVVPFRRASCARNAAESRILSRITTAARTDTPRQRKPTSGNPLSASSIPPSHGPPNIPIWLLTANNPVAVVRELPAHSINNIGVTVNDGLASAAAPQVSATVAQGETRVVKLRAASSPLPTHAR